MAELLAAVFNEDRHAGEVFHLSLDEQRRGRQEALYELRNAACHPGYLPHINKTTPIETFLGLLHDEKNPFKADVQRDRRLITTAPVARWAVNATDELGRFELGRAIVADLERQGSSVSSQQRYRIERRP